MAAASLCSNLLFGYRSRKAPAASKLALVLPFVISIALLMIADNDAPRHGIIRVSVQNLESFGEIAWITEGCREAGERWLVEKKGASASGKNATAAA